MDINRPSATPERILHVSVSFLGVVIRLCPGLLKMNIHKHETTKSRQKKRNPYSIREEQDLLSSSTCISASDMGSLGGHPLIVQPTPPP